MSVSTEHSLNTSRMHPRIWRAKQLLPDATACEHVIHVIYVRHYKSRLAGERFKMRSCLHLSFSTAVASTYFNSGLCSAGEMQFCSCLPEAQRVHLISRSVLESVYLTDGVASRLLKLGSSKAFASLSLSRSRSCSFTFFIR